MNAVNQLIQTFDGFLKTRSRVKPEAQNLSREIETLDEPLTADERKLSGNLMRFNHTGEICPLGLFKGQTVFALDQAIYEALVNAVEEELDNLARCRDRFKDLGLDPICLIHDGMQHLPASGRDLRSFQMRYR